ncbi:MAG TPA: hypothetical protein ENI23_15030 [bacterium]|nr:hypothetical protein [bacterium]
MHQWYHGVVLAMLFPDLANEEGYEIPENRDEVDVFKFQRFEMDYSDEMQAIRVCSYRMLGPPSIDPGKLPCNSKQLDALRLICKELNLKLGDEIAFNVRDMKIEKMWTYLEQGETQLSADLKAIDVADLKVSKKRKKLKS